MKKSTVTMLAVGAALVLIGGVSSTIAYLNGAVGISTGNGLLRITIGKNNLVDLGHGWSQNQGQGTAHSAVVEEIDTPSLSFAILDNNSTEIFFANEEPDSFSNVVIDSGIAEVTIRPTSSDGSLKVENMLENSLSYGIENGTLYIKNQRKALTDLNGTPKLEVNLPSNTKLDKITINAGAGEANISHIDAKTLEISGGAGKISLDKINADTLILQSGAGGIYADNFNCARLEANSGLGEIDLNGSIRHAEIKGGAGRLSFDGKIAKSFNISCGTGEVDLNLDGTPQDYYFSLVQALGSITVDDAALPAGTKYAGTPGAPCSGELTCGMGSIDVSFKGAAFTEEPDGISILSDFKNVEIQSEMADVALSAGSECLIRSDGPNDQIDWEIDEGTLRLTFDRDFRDSVEVTLPDSIDLDQVSLSTTVGDITADNLSSLKMKKFSVTTQAGDVELTQISADKIETNASAGDITIQDFTCEELESDTSAGSTSLYGNAKKADLSCAAGEIFFSGLIENEFDASTSVGSIELELAGSPDDYFFEMERGRDGRISIDGQDSGAKTFGSENARCSGDLTVTLGNIEITFSR